MSTVYLWFGVVAFWTVGALAVAAALAALAGAAYAIVAAYCGAKDWLALKAMDRFTGMTEDQRSECFRVAAEALYASGRFDAQRGEDAIAVVQHAVRNLARKLPAAPPSAGETRTT